MKQYLLLFFCIACLHSCSGVKKTEKALNTGNYNEAIQIALSKLRTNKDKKGKQPYIIMLENAYTKAQERDQKAIEYMQKENNPANLERIYNAYITINKRQEKIKPVLPLYIIDEGRDAEFIFKNYDQDIIATKEKLTHYLYTNAKNSLSAANGKSAYRKVYDDLMYLNQINPGYKNTDALIQEAHFKGTDFVKVWFKNRTNVIMPKRLEKDLLNFDTYGLNDIWTVYHNQPQPNVKYDYLMEVTLRQINVSPEQIKERQLQKEKIVKDGWEYLTDEDGKIQLDEEGNKIKVDKLVTVRCEYYEFRQFKAVNVAGIVQYKNLKTKQLLQSFPLASEYVFEHIYANYNGDERALENDLLACVRRRAVAFPSNEQMVYESGQDLKYKLKRIITRYRF